MPRKSLAEDPISSSLTLVYGSMPMRAVRVGEVLIYWPGRILIVLSCFGTFAALLVDMRLVWIALAMPLSILIAWLWWSLTVRCWRDWAAKQGITAEDIERVGLRFGLLYPAGSIESRTELKISPESPFYRWVTRMLDSINARKHLRG